jgi:hypothetical protein
MKVTIWYTSCTVLGLALRYFVTCHRDFGLFLDPRFPLNQLF